MTKELISAGGQLPEAAAHGRKALLSHYRALFPGRDTGSRLPAGPESVDREQSMLQEIMIALSGTHGRYRNPDRQLAMIDANDDQQAIESWLDVAGARSVQTARVYRKEAERFLAWAWVERGKALTSLTVDDVRAYESFLSNPVSIHQGIEWYDPAAYNAETGRVVRGRKAARGTPGWRPFDGPLSPRSIDLTIQALKSMYTYWQDVGYCVANPARVLRRSPTYSDDAAVDRALSRATWQFLYSYIDGLADEIPAEAPPRRRLALLRQANQKFMVFTALYLLGVRISELAAIRMCDFALRTAADGVETYWLRILGKGGRLRTIPVPNELIDVIAGYRRTINTFPTARSGKGAAQITGMLPILPSPNDTTHLILSTSGTADIGTSRIADVVKETLKGALERYRHLADVGRAPPNVNPGQLEKASTHWMRHTSATHQTLQGMSLLYVKNYLGHASYDTTLIYSHTDRDAWAAEQRKVTTDG